MSTINTNSAVSQPQTNNPLNTKQWAYVKEASEFVEKHLNKNGPTILQRFQMFAAMPARERYVYAIIGQKFINRAGPEERGYIGDAVETIYDHAANMNYMNLRLLERPEIAKVVYRKGRDPIQERALVVKVTREHDCPETMMFDMSKSDAEILPKGMKSQLESLSISIIFQHNATERRKMEKYADKNSTIDRHVKVIDALESVVDAIAGKMCADHFEEFLATAKSVVDEYATPQMKLVYTNKLVQGLCDYYYNGVHPENLSDRALRRAIFDVVYDETFTEPSAKIKPQI